MEKDLRVVKTKKALFEALINLTKETEFENIKIQDICNKALINRSTFYSHYSDKYDLLCDFIESLKNELSKELSKNENIINTKEYYLEMIRIILNHIDLNKNLYYSVIMMNRNIIIMDMLIDTTIKDVNTRLQINTLTRGDIPIDIFSTFYLGAVSGVLVLWLKTENKYSKEEILNYIDKLIINMD